MTKSTTKQSVEQKAVTAKQVESPAQVAVAAPSKVEKAKKEKKVAAPKKTAESAQVVAAPATTSSSENVIIATPAATESSSSLTEDFSSFFAKLQSVTALLSALKSDFRALEKKSARQLKVSQKASAKRKHSSVNRAPSGFVQPTLISDELAGFLGKDKGSKMARTEVTREINAYIRTNNLQDKENGRRINADNNLSTLLKLKKGEELTYFNLQRYMSPHFAKSAKAAAAAAAAAATATA
jgi:chromatin remodeling complex protein RSC6